MKRILLFLPFLAFFSNVNAQWVQQNSTTTTSLNDIYCVSADICYVAGNNKTLLKTIDGGNNWIPANSGISPSTLLQAVFCTDQSTCHTGEGGGDMYKTTDGGNNWQLISSPIGFAGISGIFFITDSIGYATGSGGGNYMKTTDGGENWTWEVIPAFPGILNAMYFTDIDTGYAVGGNVTTTHVIFKTTDGAANWTQVYSGAGNEFNDVFFANDSTGFAVEMNGAIFKTTNAGNTWIDLNSGIGNVLYSIYCVDEDTCYTAGSPNPESMVFKTTDGGSNWQPDTAGITTTGGFWAIHFPTPDVGYVVGAGGKIFKRGSTTNVIELTDKQASVNIYPNPFNETATIYVSGINSINTFEIYDFTGRKIREMQLNTATTKLERNDLTTGMYIYRLTNGGVFLAAGKLMVN